MIKNKINAIFISIYNNLFNNSHFLNYSVILYVFIAHTEVATYMWVVIRYSEVYIFLWYVCKINRKLYFISHSVLYTNKSQNKKKYSILLKKMWNKMWPCFFPALRIYQGPRVCTPLGREKCLSSSPRWLGECTARGVMLFLWLCNPCGNEHGQKYLISYALHENWEENGADNQLGAR